MHIDERIREAVALLEDGGSDEDVERRTGLDLLSIIELRVSLAVGRWTAPAKGVADYSSSGSERQRHSSERRL